MKKNHFQKDLISLINNIPEKWEELKPFFNENVQDVVDTHFPNSIPSRDMIEDVVKLIFRLKNNLD